MPLRAARAAALRAPRAEGTGTCRASAPYPRPHRAPPAPALRPARMRTRSATPARAWQLLHHRQGREAVRLLPERRRFRWPQQQATLRETACPPRAPVSPARGPAQTREAPTTRRTPCCQEQFDATARGAPLRWLRRLRQTSEVKRSSHVQGVRRAPRAMDSQPLTYVALLKQRQRAASAPVRRRAPPRAVDFTEPRAFEAPRAPAPAPAPTPARARRATSAAPERVRRGTGTRTAGGAAKATCARVSVVEALDRRAQAIERRAQATTRFAKEIAAEAAECKAKKAAAAAALARPGAAPGAREVVTRAVAPARVGSRAHASPPLASSTAPSPARAAPARNAAATPTRRDVGTAEVCALCSTREARESALLVELASSDSRWRRAVVHLESELGASRRHNRALEAALVRYGHAVQPAPRVASAGARDALAHVRAHAPHACPEPPPFAAGASAISTSSSRSTSTS